MAHERNEKEEPAPAAGQELAEDSDEYEDIGEEEEEEEAGGLAEDDEDAEDAEGEYEPQQRQASLTALLLGGENGHGEEEEDDDDEYDEEADVDVAREQYVPADGKLPPPSVIARTDSTASSTSTAVKRSRGELEDDEGPGVVGAGDGVDDEGYDEGEEQDAKRVKV